MLFFFIAALLWAVPSFLLHNVIHEGSHLLVAWSMGAKELKLRPFPSRFEGHWYFASCTFRLDTTPDRTLRISVAPLWAELAWLALALSGLALSPHGWFKGVLAVEVVSPLVDMTTWMLGLWRFKPNPQCDAEKARGVLAWDEWAARGSSLALLPLYGLALVFLIKFF